VGARAPRRGATLGEPVGDRNHPRLSSEAVAVGHAVSQLAGSTLDQGRTTPAVDAEPLAADATSALAGLLTEPLVVIDVGCRWGFADVWDGLGHRLLAIGFDPDAEECSRVAKLYSGRGNVRVVPVALGAEPGVVDLYQTVDPGGWSVLPTVPDVIERHPGLAGGRIEATSSVEVTTLDSWCASEGIDGVDVVKADTQGSELAVLQGSARALEGARAVEVEVEFNPLYEGVPLFGDVDRFLRERGFVLWRLRNLAHYAQRGARRDRRAEESWWFDDDLSRFPSGSGQLFWANAFYLRRSVAYPAATAGWQNLVRDACVTSALGFADLVGLALDRARETAPPEVQEVISSAMSEELETSRRIQSLADSSSLLEATVTVDVASQDFHGSGWLPVQRLDVGPVRWTGPAREASIDLPWRLPARSRVELLVLGAMSDQILETLVLEVNRLPVELARSYREGGAVCEGVLPDDYSSPRRFTRLVLRTVETIPWNDLHPDSPEDTELGVAVSWVRLTAPAAGVGPRAQS